MRIARSLLTVVMLLGLAPQTRAAWVNATSSPLNDNRNGSDMAFGDVDNDGDLDIYLSNNVISGSGVPGGNKLFLNQGGGNWTDGTVNPLADAGSGGQVAFGDIDNDGDLDLYLTNCLSSNKLFRNEGDGTWVDVTSGPLGDTACGVATAFADVDNDGDLDIYLANASNPGSNKLFRNEGGGVWADATHDPIGNIRGESVVFGDVDNDGDQDFYLASAGSNKVFRNEGDGTFSDITSGPIAFGSVSGAAFGDLDNDGDLDLYVAVSFGNNKLFRNEGSGTFVDATSGPIGYFSTSFDAGVALGDVNNDGNLDIAVGGTAKLFLNQGGGVWVDATSAPLGVAGTGAFGDVDNDGDLDIYLSRSGANSTERQNRLFRNDGEAAGNHWLHVNLVGTVSNRSGIGARVRVVRAGLTQMRELSGTSSRSGNSLTIEFGLGAETSIDSVIVNWPSGIVQVLTTDPSSTQLASVGVDQTIEITEEGTTSVGDHGPQTIRLYPSVPNPFSEATQIVFELPRAERASLAVYDVRGRLVRTLEPGELLPAGRHVVVWDGATEGGKPASPGIYFYVIEAQGVRQARRLALLR